MIMAFFALQVVSFGPNYRPLYNICFVSPLVTPWTGTFESVGRL